MKPINESVQHVMEQMGIVSEVFEPRNPDAVRSSVVTKPGVQGSKNKINQYQFTTSQGNVVKVHFKIDPDIKSKANIVFYVNDTLDDKASGGVDQEILSGVLGIVSKVADRRGLDTLEFKPWSGEGDIKTVTGLKEDRDGFVRVAANILKWVEENEPEMLPPTEQMKDLAKVFGLEPKSRLSWPKEMLEKELGHLMAYLHDGSPMLIGTVEHLENEPAYSNLYDIIPGWGSMIIEARQMADTRKSNTGQGLVIRRNRRKAVYDRLLDRYMADKWAIDKSYGQYELTRKV